MWRIVALVMHWMAMLALMITANPTNDNEDLVVFGFIISVTTSIWMTRAVLSNIQVIVRDKAVGHSKNKRELGLDSLDARTQLLVSLLSEDERARVRQRLMTDVSDGETIAIDELLYDRQNHGSSN